MKDNVTPGEGKCCFRPGAKGRWKKAPAVLVLLLLLLLNCPSADCQQRTGVLLQEIGDLIKNHYIYKVDEKYFPLRSLDELPKIFQDPYSAYLDGERMRVFQEDIDRILPGGIGISLEQKDSQIYITSVFSGTPAERAGIEGGDLVVSVDGSPVSGQAVEEVALRIRGEKGSRIRLYIRRGDQTLGFSIIREKIALPLVESGWVDQGIALIKIYSFGEGLGGKMVGILKELQETGLEGLILDLRDNQGGYVEEALAVSSLFTNGVLLKVRERDSAWQEILGPAAGEPSSVPMVVLVNWGTASAGEIMAAALKENRAAVLMGDPTFGKGTMQTLFELEGGGCLKLTTAEFTSPQGSNIEGSGVEPQYLVPAEGDQLPAARELLHSWLEGKRGGFPQPLRLSGRSYYPLRAVLQQTGRGIAAGDFPGTYLFYWNKALYCLDLGDMILCRVDQGNKSSPGLPVIVYQGSAYVQEKFLDEIMELPPLAFTGEGPGQAG